MTRTINVSNKTKALSTVDLVSIVVIVLILGFTIFTWFSSYRYKAKTAEAQTNLRLIFDAEVAYYAHSQIEDSNAEVSQPNRKVFLPVSAQPAEPKLLLQAGDFTHGDWALLNVKINNPVLYSYSVETKGEGATATFSAVARGDLNGDGHFSRWEIMGRANPNGDVLGKNQIYALDPLE